MNLIALPEGVRDDIQREIDVLRFLFAETVAAGRSGKISHEAALATEAATYRGADALAAGLADEVTDLARGFSAFRQMLSRTPTLSPMRTTRASLPQPRQEALMATQNDPDDSQQDTGIDVTDIDDAEPDTTDHPPAVVEPSPAETQPSGAAASAPAPTAPQPGNLAELSAQLREAAAEIAEIAGQAGRLGIAIDAAKALREGTTPEALRKLVLQRAADASDARDVVAAAPSPVIPRKAESPIVAAAKRAAASGTHR